MSENIKQSGEVAEAKPVTILPAEEIAKEIKPLSANGFLAFWQKLWRNWLGWWYGFADRHPKGSKWIYKIGFFLIFSNGVTLWQMLLFAVLPYAFQGLNGTEVWGWPNIEVIPGLVYPAGWDPAAWVGEPVTWLIFGDAAGIGTWLAFEISVFTAQCINLPLQRNITFKSHGNWVYQAMWYFIGWVGISIAMGALWGIMMIPMVAWGWPAGGILVLKTVITGGISMAVFFPIFIIIFPDLEKVAKKKRAKVEKLKSSGAAADVIAKAELDALVATEAADINTAEKNASKAKTQSNAKAVSYQAVVRNSEIASAKLAELEKGENVKPEELEKAKAAIASYETRVPEAQSKASEAIAARLEAEEKYQEIKSTIEAARAARGAVAA